MKTYTPSETARLAIISQAIALNRQPLPNVSKTGRKWIRSVRRENIRSLRREGKEIRSAHAHAVRSGEVGPFANFGI